MELFPFLAIMVAALAPDARLTPIVVEIQSIEAAVSYSINGQRFTSTELSAWMKQSTETFGDNDPISIRPDAQTTFRTVFDLLEELKASGIKHIEVISEVSETPDGATTRSLTIEARDVKLTEVPALPPVP